MTEPVVVGGRCSGCVFWNRNGDVWDARGNEASDWEARPTNKRKCLNVLHANDCTYDSPEATAPAIVTDGSGYAATFWTAPEFGCTSFTSVG